jgi:uncharacterized protein YcbK (DUF882 family)
LLGIGGTLAFAHHGAANARTAMPAARPAVSVNAGATVAHFETKPTIHATGAAFPILPAIRFDNQNTRESASIALYDAEGRVNEVEASKLDELLCDSRDVKVRATSHLDRRTLQLVVRAALHFHAREVIVVSAYRKPGRRREGLHASGKAVDFKLPEVPARSLAAYLRTLSRVGVGVYTHPRTMYVHLDDREHSFHWLDASPPGRSWREMSIGDASLPKRDAAYSRADDWPEGTNPPPDAVK